MWLSKWTLTLEIWVIQLPCNTRSHRQRQKLLRGMFDEWFHLKSHPRIGACQSNSVYQYIPLLNTSCHISCQNLSNLLLHEHQKCRLSIFIRCMHACSFSWPCVHVRVVHQIFSFEEFFFCLFRFWLTCLCKYITLMYSQQLSGTWIYNTAVFLITKNTGNMFIHTLIVRQSQHDKDAVVWACQARNISWERNRASTIWGLHVPKPCLTEPIQQERHWEIWQWLISMMYKANKSTQSLTIPF